METPKLEEKCTGCGGKGGGLGWTCRTCKGRCTIPTKFGQQLLDFLEHYLPELFKQLKK